MNEDKNLSFEEASQGKQSSLLADVWNMLKKNKKFWLIPLIIALLIFGIIIMVGGTAAAPFIYTLF
ncbi:MAG: hypothetical protein KDL09_03305 [Prosthecobacter sp.]|nr:DUF5989 family protein [Prosthecobacter sp.]MCB1275577.1 hypothetical protein [Prosthecobacter sp.]